MLYPLIAWEWVSKPLLLTRIIKAASSGLTRHSLSHTQGGYTRRAPHPNNSSLMNVLSALMSARLGSAVIPDLGQERVEAGGVVGRVGQGQDALVLADGKALDGAELGVLQFLAQALQVLGALGVAGGLVGGGLVGDQFGLVGHNQLISFKARSNKSATSSSAAIRCI